MSLPVADGRRWWQVPHNVKTVGTCGHPVARQQAAAVAMFKPANSPNSTVLAALNLSMQMPNACATHHTVVL